MWDRRSILATVALVCVWLAALSGCDATKSEGLTQREYRRVLVEELCAPGGFYTECWWSSANSCHEEMPRWVAECMPSEPERVQPSEALREEVLDCVFFWQSLGHIIAVEMREECLDAKRWKDIPPSSEDRMAKLRQRYERWKRKRANPQYVPATPVMVPDTAPEPSPDTAPEPSPGAAPATAPARSAPGCRQRA